MSNGCLTPRVDMVRRGSRRPIRADFVTLERYAYRVWHTNLPLTPAGVWHSTMVAPEWSHASESCVRICAEEDSHSCFCG